MKKLFAARAVLIMLFLVGCGGSPQTSASKSMTDSLSGTYVGKNGSALTLFPDGTSEYYYMLYSSVDEDKGAGEWSYKDNTLTWMYNGKPITAKINEKSALSFTLEQTDGWNREQYIKASNTAEKMSASEYQQIMRDILKQPEMDNFDENLSQSYRFGGLVFKIPFYWFVDSTDEGRTTYKAESTDSCAVVLSISYATDMGLPMDAFENGASSIWDAFADNQTYENGYSIVKEPSMISVGQLAGIQGTICTEIGGYPLCNTITVLYDESSETISNIELLTIGDTLFKYDSDYTKIINSVTVPETAKASTSGNGRTENTSGVTPELKAFLDSYETYMDQYIAFMQKYENSDDTYSMLYDYLDMMQQYADFAEKLDQYDTDKMSAVDSAYYLEVTTRVAKKLYAAAIQ